MRLTRRGTGVLIAVPVLFTVGEALGYPLFRVLAGVALAAVLAAVATAGRRIRVGVTRTVLPDRVECGTPALVELTVRNISGRRTGAFTALDRWPDGGRRIEVAQLPPGGRSDPCYRLPTTRRGRMVVGPLTAERMDLLGLARTVAVAGDTATVWVHPRRHQVRMATVGQARHHHDGEIGDRPMRGSTDVRAVREYTVGDELRHIHWRATARTGQLMVREYVDPSRPRFVVVLDTTSVSLTPERFEAAVEIAGSLLYAAAWRGHATSLCQTDGVVVHTPGGIAGARALLDALCDITQVESSTMDSKATATGTGGCLVHVGGPPDAVSIGTAAQRFGRVVVFDMAAAADRPAARSHGGRVIRLAATTGKSAATAWNTAVA